MALAGRIRSGISLSFFKTFSSARSHSRGAPLIPALRDYATASAQETRNVKLFTFRTALLAENGKLKNLDVIVKKFMQLTTAHRGDVKVLVTTVMVS
ncbi:unnamed protein product [Brassica oleracea]